jgi:hypothetical protein
MLARENPHCGVSGVPFMKRTTGADATALSIADFVCSERNRAWRACGSWKAVNRGVKTSGDREKGRNAWMDTSELIIGEQIAEAGKVERYA